MSDFAWLEAVPASAEPARAALAKPMRLAVAGAPWVIASDGAVLVAERGEAPSYPECHPSIVLRIVSYLARPEGARRPTTIEALRAWAGPPVLAKPEPCGSCQGAGASPCGECGGTGKSDRECADCGEHHDCLCDCCKAGRIYCEPCAGTGKEDGKRPVRPGRIAGLAVDRERLARVLALAPWTGEVTISCETDESGVHPWMLAVRGDRFRLFLMPLAHVAEDRLTEPDFTEAAQSMGKATS